MALERLQAERTVSDNNENNDDPRQFDKVEEMTGTKIESNRELKQATFLSTRTAAGSKLRRYRWRVMASAALV